MVEGVGEKGEHRVAEGDGPINALDNATHLQQSNIAANASITNANTTAATDLKTTTNRFYRVQVLP